MNRGRCAKQSTPRASKSIAMPGRYLLDTNIVIALFAGEPAVEQAIGRADEVFLPSIVLGELYYGAYKSARVQDNIERVARLAAAYPLINCDQAVANQYGQIKLMLKRKGFRRELIEETQVVLEQCVAPILQKSLGRVY